MTDSPQGAGWWMADDRQWYPPEHRVGMSTAPPAVLKSVPASTSGREQQPRRFGPPLIAAAAVVVLTIGLGAYLVLRSNESGTTDAKLSSTTNASGTVPSPTVTDTVPASTAPTTTAAPVAAPTTPATTSLPSLADLPRDLKCADLKNLGWTYDDAVRYWTGTGRPARMDEDGNSRPCETIYPDADVVAYFGAADPTYKGEGPVGSLGLPSGLTCSQLKDRGVPVTEALAYYIDEGTPLRMDADGNGVPCESVYPNAAEVWATSG